MSPLSDEQPIASTHDGQPIWAAAPVPPGTAQAVGVLESGEPVWPVPPGKVPADLPQPFGILGSGELVWPKRPSAATAGRQKSVLMIALMLVAVALVGGVYALTSSGPDRGLSAAGNTVGVSEPSDAAAETAAQAAVEEEAARAAAAEAAAQAAAEAAAAQAAAEEAAAQAAADAAAAQAASAAASASKPSATPAISYEDAARRLYQAYAAGNRSLAGSYGSQNAVQALFDEPHEQPGWNFLGCNPQGDATVCEWDIPAPGEVHGVWVEMTMASNGFLVESIDYWG